MLHLIHRLGIDRRNLRSLTMLPLIEVAWADGRVQAKEAELIRAKAQARRLNDDDALILEDWLRHSPSPAYHRSGRVALAWLRTTGDPGVDPAALNQLVDDARQVAAAAGGVLGFGAICRAEREAIARLEADLEAGVPEVLAETGSDLHPDFANRQNAVTLAYSAAPPGEGPATLVPMFDAPMRLGVTDRGTTIGAEDGAEVQILDDPEVAVAHCVVYPAAKAYLVRAIGGPVWVNGERVSVRRLLGGETLRLSHSSSFVFKWVRPLPG